MTKYLITLIAAVSLVGCGTQQIKLVPVDKPIPIIPVPPAVPQCDYMVDKLTPTDAAEPGKVGEAYRYDMTCARATNSMLRQIVNAYKEAATATNPVLDEINAAFSKMQADIDAAQKPTLNK